MSFVPYPDGFRLEIASKKRGWLLAQLAFGLLLWLVGAVAPVGDALLGDGQPLFLLPWLPVWGLVGAFIVYALAWNASGHESLSLQGRMLLIERGALGLRSTRRYRADGVSGLRAAGPFGGPSMFSWSYGVAYWGLSGGTIAFDYDGRTERFGIQLEEREARELVERIRGYLAR